MRGFESRANYSFFYFAFCALEAELKVGASSNPGHNSFLLILHRVLSSRIQSPLDLDLLNLDRVMGRRRGFCKISGPHTDSEFSVDRCSTANELQDDAVC